MADCETKYYETAMTLLKSNLGFFGTPVPPDLDDYLASLLNYAFDKFAMMGIHLTPGVLQDDMDQMIFAAWLYRNGVSGSGKNEMLKSIIRNRQVSNALKEDTA